MSKKIKRPLIMRKVTELKQYVGNSRTHTPEQIDQLRASMKEFGFTDPILIDEDDVILAGHARLEAADRNGMKEVPTILLDSLSDTQKKAYVIADNKLALNAGWDKEILAAEMKELDGLDFDLSVTGFNAEELEDILVGDIYEPDIDKDRVAKSKEKYDDSDVRQIVMYFGNADYEKVLKQLLDIQEAEGLEDNSQVLVYLLEMYDDGEEYEEGEQWRK